MMRHGGHLTMTLMRHTATSIALVAIVALGFASPAGSQPETLPDGSSQTEPSTGTAQGSGQASVSSGVVYPERTTGRPVKTDNKMKPGTPDNAELAEWQRVKINGNPRQEIASIVNGAVRKDWPFAARGNLIFIAGSATDGLRTTFPNHVFYVLRYPQWPIGFDVPPPLGNNNIFAVDKSCKPKLITSADKLKELFAQSARVSGEAAAKEALNAWLRLSQEIHQDGMFKFDAVPQKIAFTQTGSTAQISGQLSVVPIGGNSGDLKATLKFDDADVLVDFKEDVNLQAGMRPICQSTKLLDSDPLVRKMAEQDLLIMGKYAKPYLDWQRERVSPELQRAIDAIWRKILAENRYAEYPD